MPSKRKRETDAEKKEREERLKRSTERDKAREELECRKETKRLVAAMELQVFREQMTQRFLLYHTPRLSADEFLTTHGWLSGRYMDFLRHLLMESMKDLESEKSRQVEALTSTIVSLRADTQMDIDVSMMFGACFLGVGFPNFVRDLLKRFYPTLRHRLFRYVQIGGEFSNQLAFIWGDTLDRSPYAPRLTITLKRKGEKATISLLASDILINTSLPFQTLGESETLGEAKSSDILHHQ